MKVELQDETTLEEVADIMKVSGKLRWSDYGGNQDSTKGTITKVLSETFCELIVKDEKETFPFLSIKFAATEDGVIYMSGNQTHKMKGEIVRARDMGIA